VLDCTPPNRKLLHNGLLVFAGVLLGLLLCQLETPSAVGRNWNLKHNNNNNNKNSAHPSLALPVAEYDDVDWGQLTHLILVAGHSVYMNDDWHKGSVVSGDSWMLESYQQGQHLSFIEHIKRSVMLAAEDPRAVLMFSGGETRAVAGPRSEAQSYWMLAEFSKWFGHARSVRARSATEEFATDSFTNVLYSICRFHELTGRYPQQITVVGFEFKRARFVELHRAALRFPRTQFAYVGIDPDDEATTATATAALRGQGTARAAVAQAKATRAANEKKNGFDPARLDPYGCQDYLGGKKQSRNPFRRQHGYAISNPDLVALLQYCGESYQGLLPWLSTS
jgi:hypothetical protein